MPDAIFENPRLAEIYDDLDADRCDLDHYVAIAEEFGVRTVLDIGCGTGTLAVRLVLAGLDVTGVDPAEASLVVARRKLGADRVRWTLGDAAALPSMAVDLILMNGRPPRRCPRRTRSTGPFSDSGRRRRSLRRCGRRSSTSTTYEGRRIGPAESAFSSPAAHRDHRRPRER